MKTKIYLMAVVLAAAALFSGCAKDGATGPAGPSGSNGSNGSNGNANVISVYFGTQNFSSTSTLANLPFPSPVTTNMLDSSLVLVYHQSSGCGTNWYLSNGLGCGANYSTRIWTSGIALTMVLQNPDGSTYTGAAQTFTRIRVIIAPSSDYSGSRLSVDFSDYYATLKFFNLKDI